MEYTWKQKITSARFILTLICGLTFCTLCYQDKITPEVYMPIFTMVFVSYFTKKREDIK